MTFGAETGAGGPRLRFSANRKSIWRGLWSFAAALALVTVASAIFFALVGRDPVQVMEGLIKGAFGGRFELAETLVKATPILLASLAVAVPAQAGLVNLGAEGQLTLGAIGATWLALLPQQLPGLFTIPGMFIIGGLCGAIWAGVPAILRAWFGASEVLSTLLLNYVAGFLLDYLIHGPWRDPTSFGWPFSRALPPSAVLPAFPGTRVHLMLPIGLLAVVVGVVLVRHSSVGFELRVIGENLTAARKLGLAWRKYFVVSMMVGGFLAALAGVGEVSVIQGRLRAGLSPGYGYTGFLVAWIARTRIETLPLVSIAIAALLTGADSLQISSALPQATVDVIQGLVLLAVLISLSRRQIPGAVRQTP